MSINVAKSQLYDPRIVQTVRTLKESTLPKIAKNNNSTRPHTFQLEQSDRNEISKLSDNKPNNINNRISIDGSKLRTNNFEGNPYNLQPIKKKSSDKLINPLSCSTDQINLVHKYHTLLNANNNKSSKELTKAQVMVNDSNTINKFKSECLSLLKEDHNIVKLWEECKYKNDSKANEDFINSQLFNNKVFAYKMEIFLSNNASDNIKDLFFKKEIVNILIQRSLDIKYQIKIEMLEKAFEEHYQLINNYDK